MEKREMTLEEVCKHFAWVRYNKGVAYWRLSKLTGLSKNTLEKYLKARVDDNRTPVLEAIGKALGFRVRVCYIIEEVED